jgi:hypothetical protein
VLMFVDNSGSDVVLGMLPLARELLKLGCKVGALLLGPGSWISKHSCLCACVGVCTQPCHRRSTDEWEPALKHVVWLWLQVTLAANELPSINDVTAAELGPLLHAAAQLDSKVLGCGGVGNGVWQVVMCLGDGTHNANHCHVACVHAATPLQACSGQRSATRCVFWLGPTSAGPAMRWQAPV